MAKELICRECLNIGKPRKVKRGSAKMEWIMWLVLLIPGPFYSVWRATGKKKCCAVCGSELLSGLDTPVGRRLVEIADKQVSGALPVSPRLMEKIRKPDAKAMASVQASINDVMRAEAGMTAEKENCHPERSEGSQVIAGDPSTPGLRPSAQDDTVKQRPRGASGEQKPEDW